jgi:hypothetical protein
VATTHWAERDEGAGLTIKLERRNDVWVVVGDRVLSVSQKIEDAALSAILLADLQGTSVKLGCGVPEEVLDHARGRAVQLETSGVRVLRPKV